MANLPPGTATIGPVYISTELKDLFVKSCELDTVLMSDAIKEDVSKRVKKHFPGYKQVE